ncbi:MAG: hypothetical protein JSR48_05260 [Verrucomicrobia bacterium]|nr:hypothetical protein [Verrucomicrobiota bacterium]
MLRRLVTNEGRADPLAGWSRSFGRDLGEAAKAQPKGILNCPPACHDFIGAFPEAAPVAEVYSAGWN